MPEFLTTFLITLALNVAAYGISAATAPDAAVQGVGNVQDLQTPTAEAGVPVPVVFGTVKKATNVLWYGDKEVVNYKVKV